MQTCKSKSESHCLFCQCQSPAKAGQLRQLPQPPTHPQGRGYLSGQRLLLEEDLAAGADQAHLAILAAKEWQGWLFRALRQPPSLCLILSFPLPLPALLPTRLFSLLQSSLACVSEKPSGNFVTGLGAKSR